MGKIKWCDSSCGKGRIYATSYKSTNYCPQISFHPSHFFLFSFLSIYLFPFPLLCFCYSLFSSFLHTSSEHLRILYELINCPFSLYLSSVFHIYLAVLVSSASYWALSFVFLQTTFLLDLSLWHDQCIKAGGLVSARFRMRAMRVKSSHLTMNLPSHSFPALILRFNGATKQETESYLCINKHWQVFLQCCLHLSTPPCPPSIYSIFAVGPLLQFRVRRRD